MLSKVITKICAGVLSCLIAQSTLANLLINPTRVLIGNNDRSTEITLINTSQTTNTYRIEWAEKKAKDTGGYVDLTPEAASQFPVASKMIRYSPRQVMLKPGERQTVKLAIRRPPNLANGEYRSHIQFKALPPPKPANGGEQAQNMSISMLVSFAIPVVVVQGPVNYNLGFEDAQIYFNPAKNQGRVMVQMNRSGPNSVIGNISAYWTPNGGKEVMIAKLGEFNFWPELNHVNAELTWAGTEFAKTDGKLRIVYEGVKEFRGKVFFDKTLNVQGSAIKMAN